MADRDYEREVRALLDRTNAEATAADERGDHAEAKRVINGAIRDLREMKRELTETERAIRENVRDARLQTRKSGQTIGLFMGSKARGSMARSRAREGRKLSERQADALRPIAAFKSELDRLISALDGEKARVTDAQARAKSAGSNRSTASVKPAASPPPPPPGAVPPPPPPHWAPDPAGRHEHRYWDGTRWTDHVGNRGATSIDPYDVGH
jgi:hypothetical protein